MKKSIIQEAKEQVKKQKKEKETMKNNTTLRTIITVTTTLLVVAAFAFTFYQGVQFGTSNEKAKQADVHSQVKDLTVVTKK